MPSANFSDVRNGIFSVEGNQMKLNGNIGGVDFTTTVAVFTTGCDGDFLDNVANMLNERGWIVIDGLNRPTVIKEPGDARRDKEVIV